MNHAPIILVTPFWMEMQDKNDIPAEAVKVSYLNAILKCGGLPLIVPFRTTDDGLRELSELADGLLLPGGGDIDPELYNEKPIAPLSGIFSDRDALELSLFKIFFETKKPILGVCRGSQIINIAKGGTLFQDIKKQIPSGLCHRDPKLSGEELYLAIAHGAAIQKDTFLSGIFGERTIGVNSTHHQSIKNVGEGLKISALAPDGVVEGIESVNMNDHWILGVQWHPEAMLPKSPKMIGIYEKFIEAARTKR